LTPKREAFACGLAKGLSQSAAYREAFPRSLAWQPDTVWRRASELAADGEVRGRVAELQARAAKANEVTVERVVAELARLAFFDVRRLVGEDGSPRKLTELDEDTARAIAGVDVARVGNDEIGVGEVLKFKLADKGANLERLGRHLAMFKDVVLTGELERLTDEQLAAKRAALLAKAQGGAP
jgi:phage terminase small subunit